MTQLAQENILVIGDNNRQITSALLQAHPAAQITSVPNYFEAVAELTSKNFTTVLASSEPIERRPEAAVSALRQAAGDGRILLFGQATLEPLSRKMLSFGIDDYIVTPTSAGELAQIFGTPPLRLATDKASDQPEALPVSPPSKLALLNGIPLTELVLDAMLQHPQGSPSAAIKQISSRIGPSMQLSYFRQGTEPLDPPQGAVSLMHTVRIAGHEAGSLQLILPQDEEQSGARHFLAQLAS